MRSGCRLLNKQVSACETLKTEHLSSHRIGRALVVCHVTLAQVNMEGGTWGCIVTYPLGACHSDRLKRKKIGLLLSAGPNPTFAAGIWEGSNNELYSVYSVLVLIANKADWIQVHGKQREMDLDPVLKLSGEVCNWKTRSCSSRPIFLSLCWYQVRINSLAWRQFRLSG